MDSNDGGFDLGKSRPDPPGWADGAPTSGIGQSCAFCSTRDVTWVHPLTRNRVTVQVYGAEHTLPGFWALCDRCEEIYASEDDDAAIEIMRSSDGWPVEVEGDVEERIRKPLGAFRRADRGARRFDPERPELVEARKWGFVPLCGLTGVADTLGPLWPPEHRLWLEELGPVPGEEFGETLDRWLVRSPWPSLSVQQALLGLWAWVERAPFPYEDEVWRARVLEFFGWSESEARVFVDSHS